MIRVLFALLLIFNFSLTMSACTSPGTSDSAEEGPISDEDIAGDDSTGDEDAEEEEMDDTSTADNNEEGSSDSDELEPESEVEAEGNKEEVAKSEADDSLELDGDIEEDETKTEKPVAQNEPIEKADVLDPESELEPEAPPAATEKARITDIRYIANASGGTVLIEGSQALTYQTRMNAATNQFVIELAGVELPPNLQRPYQVSPGNTRIAGINAYQSQGSDTARIVVQLSANGSGEPIVQQEGSSLVVIPPAPAPAVAKANVPPTRAAGVSKGKKEQSLSARTLDEFLTGNQQFFGRRISLQVKEADVRDVVNFLAEESGANIVMSDDVGGKISLKLRRVPWDQALVTVMRTKALGYVRQGEVLRISTLKALQEETESANRILESQKAIVPAVVQVFAVNYANLDDLVKNLAPFLSAEGKIVADNRTNTLVVTDKEPTVQRIAKLAKTLDIPPTQVSIESKVVEASEEFQRFLGITWGQSGAPTTLSAAGGAQGAPIDLRLSTSQGNLSAEFMKGNPFNMSLEIGTLDLFGDLSAQLSLAERESIAKIISAPRISTMNREKATIRQEGEDITITSIFNSTNGTILKSANRTPFKLELSVTPQITSDGSVIMDLEVVREFQGAVVENETQARPINKRYSKTKVLVRNGQTAVIGGIFTSDEIDSSTGVPGLRNIPILGWLFKNKSFNRVKNELLVFMTPRIMAQDVGTKAAFN